MTFKELNTYWQQTDEIRIHYTEEASKYNPDCQGLLNMSEVIRKNSGAVAIVPDRNDVTYRGYPLESYITLGQARAHFLKVLNNNDYGTHLDGVTLLKNNGAARELNPTEGRAFIKSFILKSGELEEIKDERLLRSMMNEKERFADDIYEIVSKDLSTTGYGTCTVGDYFVTCMFGEDAHGEPTGGCDIFLERNGEYAEQIDCLSTETTMGADIQSGIHELVDRNAELFGMDTMPAVMDFKKGRDTYYTVDFRRIESLEMQYYDNGLLSKTSPESKDSLHKTTVFQRRHGADEGMMCITSEKCNNPNDYYRVNMTFEESKRMLNTIMLKADDVVITDRNGLRRNVTSEISEAYGSLAKAKNSRQIER